MLESHLSIPISASSKLINPCIHLNDLSNVEMGAMLFQEYDEKLHPVAFASKKLSPAGAKYLMIELECLAIVWAYNKFKLFLMSRSCLLCRWTINHLPI